jgi:WD40 repeat protein
MAPARLLAQDALPQAFMAFLDYDAFHDALIERCASQFPESAASLRAAIEHWTRRSRPALAELRRLTRDRMRREGRDEKDVDARTAQAAAKLTAFMITGLADPAQARLADACTGGYSAQLAGAEMDYVGLLARAKAEARPNPPSRLTTTGSPLRLTQRVMSRTDPAQAQSFGSLAWSPDGRMLAVQGHSPLVRLFDASGKPIVDGDSTTMKGSSGRANVAYSADGRWLAAGLYAVLLWETAAGALARRIDGPPRDLERAMGATIRLAFAPDSKALAVAYSIGEQRKPTSHRVVLYDVPGGNVRWTSELKNDAGHALPIWTPVSFGANGKHLVYAVSEYRPSPTEWETRSAIVVLRAADGGLERKIENIHADTPNTLAVSHDGRYAATGTRTGTKSTRLSIAFKTTHRLDNRDPIRIWDLASGALVKELPIDNYARSLAFSPDGRYLVTAHSRGGPANSRLEFMVWHWESGRLLQTHEMPSSLDVVFSMAFSPDGTRLAAVTGSALLLFDVEK